MSTTGQHRVPRRQPGLPSSSRRPLAVLFVDPDFDNAARLARALAWPAEVGMVGSVQGARAALQTRTPDLVVLELDLPDASGIDLIATVHSASETHNVLLLVLTTRASVRDKIAAFQAGADDYLVKPVHAEQFAQHVYRLCRFQQVLGR